MQLSYVIGQERLQDQRRKKIYIRERLGFVYGKMHWIQFVSVYTVICALNIGLSQGSRDTEVKELYNRIAAIKNRLIERLLWEPKTAKDGDCPPVKCKSTAGADGLPGTKGAEGSPGLPGYPGLSGDHGRPCVTKPAGFLAPLKGYPGKTGPKGHKGYKGSKGKCTCGDNSDRECQKCPNVGYGKRGPPGEPGQPGIPGVKGITGAKGETLLVDGESALPVSKCIPDP